MKKTFLVVFVGILLVQAAMHGEQPAENKRQQDDIAKSRLSQSEPGLLVFFREKKDSRMFYRVSSDPNCDKEWLKEMLTKGKAVIKYQSAGESKITIYDIKVQGEPSPVQYVCIDKADTNVIGHLTVLKKEKTLSYYKKLPNPYREIEKIVNMAQRSPDIVKYKSSYEGGCGITIYGIGDISPYVCIQQRGGWTPGNYYEMGNARAREIMDVELDYMPNAVNNTRKKIKGEILRLPADQKQNYIEGIFDVLKTYPKFQWDKEENKTKIGKYGRFTETPKRLWPKGNYGAMGECRAYELKKSMRTFHVSEASRIIHYINWEYNESLRTAGQENADKYAYGVNNEMMRPTPERNVIPTIP